MNVSDELKKLISPDRVIEDHEIRGSYVQNALFVKGALPTCVVRPISTEEIREIVLWAGASRVPLVPASSGAPHLKGGSTPTLGGIVVDLSQMDQIVAMDRDYRVVMVEPGVTFPQLKRALEDVGLRIPTPLSPRRSKSVLASVLDREPVTIPKYHIDMSAPLLCAEIIFGTGDVFRTGEASGPGTIAEQVAARRKQVWDSGPGQISFARLIQASQGAMGIVTWSTLRCEVLPVLKDFMFFPANSLADLINFVYRVLRFKLGEECFILNNVSTANLMAGSRGGVDLGNNLPPWLLVIGIAGYEYFPEERIEYQKQNILTEARRLGLMARSTIPGGSAKAFLESLEQPTEPFWKLRPYGGCSDIFFLTTLDRVPQHLSLMYGLCIEYKYDVNKMGVYVQPIQQGRSCHCEFNLTYTPDSKESDTVRRLICGGSEALIKEGAFFSRPYGDWARMAWNRDAATHKSIVKLKRIFDPQDIMNPGKLCWTNVF